MLAVPNFYSNSIDFIPMSPSSVEEEEKYICFICSSLTKIILIHLIPKQKYRIKFLLRYHVTLKVYDILSNEVSTLVNE